MWTFAEETTTKVFVRGLVCTWNFEKMQSESNEVCDQNEEFSSRTVGESKYQWRATLTSKGRKFGETNWMNHEEQTTLLNTCPPQMIATILMALRERIKEKDQQNAVEEIAGPAPEIPLEYDQIMKG